MSEKKLNESELKDVAGGATRPMIGAEPEPVGVNRIGICISCGETLFFPSTGHGDYTCPNCKTVNHY